MNNLKAGKGKSSITKKKNDQKSRTIIIIIITISSSIIINLYCAVFMKIFNCALHKKLIKDGK